MTCQPSFLSLVGLPLPLSLYHLPVVDSTNARLWQLYQQGHLAPVAVCADRQTAGRGQWGRTWDSPLGGLYLSLLVELPQQLGPISPWVLATAWGIAAQLRGAQIPVQLKWPNDLLLRAKKLGGIKLETKSPRGSGAPLVIGVGINWSNPLPSTGASLQAFCHQQNLSWPDPLPNLTRLVLQGILDGLEVYQNQGIEAILERYHRYFAHRGREIKLEQGWGTIVGVTAQGELAVLRRSPGATSRMYFPPGSLQLGYLDSDTGPNHCRDEKLDPKEFPLDA